MPMIRLLGKRWNFAIDDLLIFCSLEAFLRFILFFTFLIYTFVALRSVNYDSTIFYCFLYSFLIVTLIIAFLNVITAIISSRGPVLNSKPREKAPLVFTIRILMLPLECAFIIVGAIWLNRNRAKISRNLKIPTLVLLIISCSILFIIFVLGVFFFDPLFIISPKSRFIWTNRLWKIRLICCFCIGLRKRPPSPIFNSAAEILSRVYGTHDLVVSDLAAGLVLLTQKAPQKTQNPVIETINNRIDSPSWINILNLYYFYNHALSIYTWPMYIYLNSISGLFALFKLTRFLTKRSPIPVHGTIFESLNYFAMKLLAPSPLNEIVYVNLTNDIYRIPFCVTVDHEKRAVVIVLRGTMSVNDIITDLSGTIEPLNFRGVEGYCHKGMYEVAKEIYSVLSREQLLNRLFLQHYGYNLIVCGHSLGAGSAAILSLILKNSYPSLTCYAYSTPHCLSENLAEASKDFIVSILLGYDVVPRLSLYSIEDLRERIITALAECSLPKYQILLGAFIRPSCAEVALDEEEAERFSLISTNERVSILLLSSPMPRAPELFVPGNIIQISVVENDQCAYDEPIYQSNFKHAKDFRTIIVHPRMFADHMPLALLKALKKLSDHE